MTDLFDDLTEDSAVSTNSEPFFKLPLAKAGEGDTDAQKFVADKFTRFFHPDLVLKSDTASPLMDYIKQLHDEVERMVPASEATSVIDVTVAPVGDGLSDAS